MTVPGDLLEEITGAGAAPATETPAQPIGNEIATADLEPELAPGAQAEPQPEVQLEPNAEVTLGEPVEPDEPFSEVIPTEDRSATTGDLFSQKDARITREEFWSRARTPAQAAAAKDPGAAAAAEAEAAAQEPGSMEELAFGEVLPKIGAVALDIAEGVFIEGIPQAFGGVTEGIEESAASIKDLADLASGPGFIVDFEPKAGIGLPVPTLRLASGKEIKETPGTLEFLTEKLLPDVKAARTTTGGIIRAMAQFGVSFLLTKNIKALQGLSALGRVGKATSNVARAGIADFAAFNPADKRLANIIQENTELEGPVLDALASDPNDPAALNRLRGMAEGFVAGGVGTAVAKTVAPIFVAGVKALRGVKRAQGAAGIKPDVIESAIQVAENQKTSLERLLGGSINTDPLFRVIGSTPDDAAAAAARGIGEPGEVFINWSRIDSVADVKEIMQQMANSFKPTIDVARRGVQTWRQTKLKAKELDAWELLSERKVGQPFNAEETVAVRELWLRAGKQLLSTAEAMRGNQGGNMERIAMRKMLSIYTAVQEQVLAARTETARATNAWAIPVGVDDTPDFIRRMGDMQEIIRRDNDIDVIAKELLNFADNGMTREADAWALGAARATGYDQLRQAWIGALLSSPHTIARNIIGTTAALVSEVAERKYMNLMGQITGNQFVPDGETSALMFGMFEGLKDSVKMTATGREVFTRARRLRIEGDPEAAQELVQENASELGPFFRNIAAGAEQFGSSRVDLPRQSSFSPELQQPKANSLWGKAFTKTGSAIEGADPSRVGLGRDTPLGMAYRGADAITTAPMRSLSASDEVFKAMAWRGEMRAQSFRQARTEVDTGMIPESALKDRVATLINNPDERSRIASDMFAKHVTFTNQPAESSVLKLYEGFAKIPVIGRLFLPFRRTPFNMYTFAFRRSPVPFFVKSWREDIKAGGERGQRAYAQLMLGTATFSTLANMAMNGDITGTGPRNRAEREIKKSGGDWQPNSARFQFGLREDGTPNYRFFDYRGLDPISMPMALASNFVELMSYIDAEDDDEDYDELAMAGVFGTTEVIQNQLGMQGIADLLAATSDPRKVQNFVNRMATSLTVPRGVALGARLIDPTLRMYSNPFEAIAAQTPGYSDDLPFQPSLWGEPMSRASGLGWGYDALSPIYSKRVKQVEPINRELNRLELWIGRPSPRVTFANGAEKDLKNSPLIYHRYQVLAGNELKKKIDGRPLTDTKKSAPVFLMQGMGAKDELNALVTGSHPLSGLYAAEKTDGKDGSKADQIRSIMNKYRAEARKQLLVEFPELKAEMDVRALALPRKLQSVPNTAELLNQRLLQQ